MCEKDKSSENEDGAELYFMMFELYYLKCNYNIEIDQVIKYDSKYKNRCERTSIYNLMYCKWKIGYTYNWDQKSNVIHANTQ